MSDFNPLVAGLRNMLNIPDLRKRIFFMLGMLACYRVGSFIPTPGINTAALQAIFDQQAGTIFGFLNMFSGGNLSRLSIFALGITPYITSSIILQLLTVVWPYLERLSKEGDLGRKKINQYTRYLTIALSIFQGFATSVALERAGTLGGGDAVVPNPGWSFRLMAMITLTTGTALVDVDRRADFRAWNWKRNIAHHLCRHRRGLAPGGGRTGRGFARWHSESAGGCRSPGLDDRSDSGGCLRERGQRRIPIQYAKRVVGRKMYGGQASHLPLRVNSGGVIPVIFAASIVAFPSTLQLVFPGEFMQNVATQLQQGYPAYNFLYIVGIIFFCFFYVSIIFNPDEVADNIRKYGGFIPGIRPGRRTSDSSIGCSAV